LGGKGGGWGEGRGVDINSSPSSTDENRYNDPNALYEKLSEANRVVNRHHPDVDTDPTFHFDVVPKIRSGSYPEFYTHVGKSESF
jgi:hypothetical protein